MAGEHRLPAVKGLCAPGVRDHFLRSEIDPPDELDHRAHREGSRIHHMRVLLNVLIDAALLQLMTLRAPAQPRIVNGGLPVVSPDGRRIAFSSNKNGTDDLYVIESATGNALKLSAGTAGVLACSVTYTGLMGHQQARTPALPERRSFRKTRICMEPEMDDPCSSV